MDVSDSATHTDATTDPTHRRGRAVDIERVVIEGVAAPSPQQQSWLLAALREELSRLATSQPWTSTSGSRALLRSDALSSAVVSGEDPHRLGVEIARGIHSTVERFA